MLYPVLCLWAEKHQERESYREEQRRPYNVERPLNGTVSSSLISPS